MASPAPLAQAPDARSLKSYGINYEANTYFQFQGPKGMPDNVRDAWAKAIEDAVKSDELSELAT